MPLPLLTIAIPTYNRAKLLDRCLEHLTKQISNKDERVELIVSDNCSPDDTNEIVKKYIEQGFKINYVINSENLGAEGNHAQCFSLAKGQFIYLLGDDDYLEDGAIDLILNIIHFNPDCGLIHLNCWDKNLKLPEFKQAFLVVNDKTQYIKYVHYWITFISANIVNRNFIDWIDLKRDIGTELNQVHIFLEAYINATENVIICNKFIGGGGIENTGGYGLLKVFGQNFNIIMNEVKLKTGVGDFIKIINNNLLKYFFPIFIVALKKNKHKFTSENEFKVMYPVFKKNIFFWVLNMPLLILPYSLGSFVLKYVFNKIIK